MVDLNKALTSSVDMSLVEKNNEKIESLVKVVQTMVNTIQKGVCEDLDAYMSTIDDVLRDSKNPPTDGELEEFTLNLPCLLYTVSCQREALKIKEDVAKAVYKEVYNNIRSLSEGTVADKDTAAELAAQSEAVSVIVLQRAGASIRCREEAALEMLNAVKKVLSRRIEQIKYVAEEG